MGSRGRIPVESRRFIEFPSRRVLSAIDNSLRESTSSAGCDTQWEMNAQQGKPIPHDRLPAFLTLRVVADAVNIRLHIWLDKAEARCQLVKHRQPQYPHLPPKPNPSRHPRHLSTRRAMEGVHLQKHLLPSPGPVVLGK